MPPRTPKSPGNKPATAGRAAPAPTEDELAQRLEQTEAQLGVQQDKLARLATAQAALGTEHTSLSTQLTAERTQFGDISSFLRHALAEQSARVEGLERELADARAALAAAAQAAADAAAAAEARRRADVGERQAVLDAQADRVREAETFLAERDSLRAQAAAAQATLEQERRAHHKRHMDLERKHASDRELWRKDTAEAVRAAREEMAALADRRLDATTKQTICDNEAMAGELQYQGRHVQGLLARNSVLQKEVAELRLALSIGRKNEEELARKNLACEKTIESLLARLEDTGEQVATGEHALAELTAQLADAQAEAHLLGQRLEDQAQHMAGLEDQLEKKQQELRQVRASHGDAASFVLQCLAEARQEVLADQGRTALAAAASAVSLMAEPTCSPGEQQEPLGSGASFAGQGPIEAGERTQVQLAALPPAHREAVLQRLLDRLGVDWQEREGLVLPASGSPSTCSLMGLGGSPSRRAGLPPASCSLHNLSPSASGCGIGGSSSAASEALMRQLCSDVRPWGTGSGSGAAVSPRRQASVASAASCGRAGRGAAKA
ncbi:hypothetical protein ABPG75_012296 [Micractinium tetrahymenae]